MNILEDNEQKAIREEKHSEQKSMYSYHVKDRARCCCASPSPHATSTRPTKVESRRELSRLALAPAAGTWSWIVARVRQELQA